MKDSMLLVRQASGLEYLKLVTGLLQRARQINPTGGIWEAADFQWWWRRDQHHDPARQTFWFDNNTPIAALVFTHWSDHLACDIILTTTDPMVTDLVWARALQQFAVDSNETVEINARDDDSVLLARLAETGFVPTGEVGVETRMLAKDRPERTPLPNGFELVSRSDTPTRPHPLIRRNDEHISERLGECSLYQPELDLAVYAPNGDVAAYGLFWADPVTHVGLVEPMRTEDRYQKLGLARHLLIAGLDRLASAGCSAFKVTYIDGNQASQRLYLGTGFLPQLVSRAFRRKH